MKKYVAMAFAAMMFMAGGAVAGDNGGQADRYHEAETYPTSAGE